METTAKNSNCFIAGLLTAAAASICCITPFLALLGGASGLAASFSWIAPYRPYLIGLTVIVFAFIWYQKLKPLKQPDCNCDTGNKKTFLQSNMFLSIVTIAAGLLIAFPYYAKAFYPTAPLLQTVIDNKSQIRHASFKIRGMGCEGCIEEVNNAVAKLKGVINYQTSFEKANSIVTFDNNKTSVDSIAAAINSTGYKVVAQTTNNN
jgi:mercuric ion transport protein